MNVFDDPNSMQSAPVSSQSGQNAMQGDAVARAPQGVDGRGAGRNNRERPPHQPNVMSEREIEVGKWDIKDARK